MVLAICYLAAEATNRARHEACTGLPSTSTTHHQRGIFVPTTPDTTGPVWMPTRMRTGSPVVGSSTRCASRSMAWGANAGTTTAACQEYR